MHDDVFITGIGIVSPAGRNTEETWSSLLDNKRFVRHLENGRLEGCNIKFAGHIDKFVIPSGTDNFDRRTQLAITAADQAIESAKLLEPETDKAFLKNAPVVISVNKYFIGYNKVICSEFPYLFNSAIYKDSILYSTILGYCAGGPAKSVADRFSVTGDVYLPVSACSTGAYSIIRAAQIIEDGKADVVLCGSTDSSIHPLWFGAYQKMGILAHEHPERGPGWSCRPFDRTRNGFTVGEGAAVL
ncbi:MAG: beta-ketoacyl synthase N-terminal-like domain-containing protein, partial [Planctomycetota bacterium]